MREGDGYKRTLIEWLHENFNNNYDVIKGVTRRVRVLREFLRRGFSDQVNIIASHALRHIFRIWLLNIRPSQTLSPRKHPSGRGRCNQVDLREIKPKQGRNVLKPWSFRRREVDPSRSRYASTFCPLTEKRSGKVLNRNELLKKYYDEVEYEIKYRLEPELVVVVVASLIYTGDSTMTVGRLKIDAGNIEELGKMPLEELLLISQHRTASDLPIPELKELFEFLGFLQA